MEVRVCLILSSLPVFTASSLVAAPALAGIALQASSFPYGIYRVWHLEYLPHRGLEPT
jgi:nitric oxide reductase large subunit